MTLPAALGLLLATPAVAQDRLGQAVAVHGDQILLLKPVPNRGPAAIHVFHQHGGAWQLAARLTTEAASRAGHELSPSLAIAGARAVVGSGDPMGAWGAHIFERSAEGWEEAGGLRLADPRQGDAQGSAGTPVSFARVMQILQPAARIVVAHGERVAVSVASGPTRGSVRVYELQGVDWEARAHLAPDDSVDRSFGASIALHGNTLAVGAPSAGGSGAVVLFERGPAGAWVRTTMLAPAGLVRGSRFGQALALDNDFLVVGAPGANGRTGLAIAFAREGDEWAAVGRLEPADTAANARFGAALALLGREILIGAPGAAGGRGAVHSFLRHEGELRAAAPLEVTVGEGFLLGASVAVGERFAVAGAPGADGTRGRAAVFARDAGGGWSAGEWITLDGDLEMLAGREIRCTDGAAAGFECHEVDLEAFLPLSALGGDATERVSDLWGWTDPETGREYALVGRTGGLVFVDITDPARPTVLGTMRGNASGARDVKVYADHAFLTGDGAGNHGLLVFDLTRLRGAERAPVEFEPDARYEGIASAHNLVIDTATGFAYPVAASAGGETCGGGLHMVDIRDPTMPTFAGCFTDDIGLLSPGRTHDAQCVVYDGPDDDYRAREICFASNETALRIVDVTDKANPTPIAMARHPGVGYVHQGWLTDDHQYFYLDDELDEIVGTTDRTRTMIWDIADLDDPVLAGEFRGSTNATDHNLYVVGDRMYQANYQAGLRVMDISDPLHPVEIGYFDTTPYEGNFPAMTGAWTAYPFFRSGTVIVSSMYEGLFVLKPRRREPIP
jgi:choice-of-anchor B domain-containing protein